MTDTTVTPPADTTIQDVLTAVDTALGVLKNVASLPGVNLLPYASIVSSAISAIQAAEKLGVNIYPYVIALKNTFSGGVPTQAAMDALDAKIVMLNAEIDAALPDKDPDEPD
jgi:hypothetical protein